jgi:hypothetical protein
MRNLELVFIGWAVLAGAFSASDLRVERCCLLAFTDSNARAKVSFWRQKNLLCLDCATCARQAGEESGSLQRFAGYRECKFFRDGYFLLGKEN